MSACIRRVRLWRTHKNFAKHKTTHHKRVQQRYLYSLENKDASTLAKAYKEELQYGHTATTAEATKQEKYPGVYAFDIKIE